MFELGYKKQGPDSIGLKKTGSPKTGSQCDSTLADNVMACFFFNVGLYIIFMYHFIYVYTCMSVCVHALVSALPGDITLLTAVMGFLESVFEDHL